MTEKHETYGFILKVTDGKVINITPPGKQKINIDDEVFSAGRIFASKGTRGRVISIDIPFSNNKTTNVIWVHWEGKDIPLPMKAEDLQA